MKTKLTNKIYEILFFGISISFLFACSITRTYTAHSPELSSKSNDAGQITLGGSYSTGTNKYCVENDYYGHYADPRKVSTNFEYYSANARIGIAKGLDFGIDYTFKENQNPYISNTSYQSGNVLATKSKLQQSYWLNAKYQFVNKDMKPGKPVIAIGLTQGFATGFDQGNTICITSIPFMFGVAINQTDLVQLTTKYEIVDYNTDSYTRWCLGLGGDVALFKVIENGIALKLKPRVGYIMDFAHNNDSSSWYYNLGISIDIKPE